MTRARWPRRRPLAAPAPEPEPAVRVLPPTKPRPLTRPPVPTTKYGECPDCTPDRPCLPCRATGRRSTRNRAVTVVRADRCPACDLPMLAETHTHHPAGCGIDSDGCTCPQTHPWCCETCKEPA